MHWLWPVYGASFDYANYDLCVHMTPCIPKHGRPYATTVYDQCKLLLCSSAAAMQLRKRTGRLIEHVGSQCINIFAMVQGVQHLCKTVIANLPVVGTAGKCKDFARLVSRRASWACCGLGARWRRCTRSGGPTLMRTINSELKETDWRAGGRAGRAAVRGRGRGGAAARARAALHRRGRAARAVADALCAGALRAPSQQAVRAVQSALKHTSDHSRSAYRSFHSLLTQSPVQILLHTHGCHGPDGQWALFSASQVTPPQACSLRR